MTTKREAQRQTHQENVLLSLGFTQWEAEKLRRISMTLHRWHELECGIDGGCIERNEETGKPHWRSAYTGKMSRLPVADREKGALRRLGKIMGDCNTRRWIGHAGPISDVALSAYVQTDPRGAALYILRPGDLPEGCKIDSCYTRGICVY